MEAQTKQNIYSPFYVFPRPPAPEKIYMPLLLSSVCSVILYPLSERAAVGLDKHCDDLQPGDNSLGVDRDQ